MPQRNSPHNRSVLCEQLCCKDPWGLLGIFWKVLAVLVQGLSSADEDPKGVRGISRNQVVAFGGPPNRYSIWWSTLGSPFYGNYHVIIVPPSGGNWRPTRFKQQYGHVGNRVCVLQGTS